MTSGRHRYADSQARVQAQRASQGPKLSRTAILGAQAARDSGSPLEKHLETSLTAAGITGFLREFRFHPTRRWRVDFVWVVARLAVEIEGGIYRGGGHTSTGGLKRDIEKSNALTLAGWRLLRFHGDQIRSGEAVEVIRQALDSVWGDRRVLEPALRDALLGGEGE